METAAVSKLGLEILTKIIHYAQILDDVTTDNLAKDLRPGFVAQKELWNNQARWPDPSYSSMASVHRWQRSLKAIARVNHRWVSLALLQTLSL